VSHAGCKTKKTEWEQPGVARLPAPHARCSALNTITFLGEYGLKRKAVSAVGCFRAAVHLYAPAAEPMAPHQYHQCGSGVCTKNSSGESRRRYTETAFLTSLAFGQIG
jgi:hypothetical protein